MRCGCRGDVTVEQPDGRKCGTLYAPSIARAMQTYLQHACIYKKSDAGKSNNATRANEADGFLTSLAAEFNKRVAKIMNIKQRGRIELIPYTEDLKVVVGHIKATISTLMDELKTAFSIKNYDALQQYTMAAIFMFNFRRTAEITNIEMAEYENRRIGVGKGNEEILNSLSESEKLLSRR